MAVIDVADQNLAIFRMQDGKHIHRALELSLVFGPVQPILSLILKLVSYEGPPDPVVVPGGEGAHVVALLLLMVKLVFILETQKQGRWVTAWTRSAPRAFAYKTEKLTQATLTSLAISREALADCIGMASSRTSQLIFTSSQPSR